MRSHDVEFAHAGVQPFESVGVGGRREVLARRFAMGPQRDLEAVTHVAARLDSWVKRSHRAACLGQPLRPTCRWRSDVLGSPVVTSRLRRSVAIVVVAVVALPGVLATFGDGHDDFPLSSYPMFAGARPATTELVGAVLVSADGGERRLSPSDVSGTPEPLQATALIERALRGDATDLCRAIVGRIGPLTTGEQVVLVRDRVNAVVHYTGDAAASERVRHVDCAEAGP